MVARGGWMAALLVAALPAGSVMAQGPKAPTVEEARRFVEDANGRLLELGIEADRAAWVQSNFITHDTELLSAASSRRAIEAAAGLAKQATRFDGLKLPPDVERQLTLLKVGLTLAAPADPKEAAEVTELASAMEGEYGRGKWCRKENDCLDINAIEQILAESRDPNAARVTRGWAGTPSPVPCAAEYTRFVELSNKGARELGFKDTGAMWRAKYDMPPDAFAKEVDRLWEQVRPLYVSLHAYVRRKLRENYGPDVVPANGPIPAHLLGNMWAQEWGNIYPLVAPRDGDPGYRPHRASSRRSNVDAQDMVRYGERFFTSLGFAPLPADVLGALAVREAARPRRRLPRQRLGRRPGRGPPHQDVHRDQRRRTSPPSTTSWATTSTSAPTTSSRSCSATAPTTASTRPSATPSRSRSRPPTWRQIGLLDKAARRLEATSACCCAWRSTRSPSCRSACSIDQWRWKVFSGEITPADYNEAWWELRAKYQGVVPPVARTRGRLRPRRQVPRAGQRALHALLPGRHPPVPVPPRAVQGGRAARARSTAARSTGARRRGSACRRCWRWARAGPGRTRWRRSPASGRWTPRPSSTTSRRSRSGWTSRTPASRRAGRAAP